MSYEEMVLSIEETTTSIEEMDLSIEETTTSIQEMTLSYEEMALSIDKTPDLFIYGLKTGFLNFHRIPP